MRHFKVGEEVLLNTAPLFASPIRTDKWIDAEIVSKDHGNPPRYWVFHDCGSPLWVSSHFLKEKPDESIHPAP
jgi:hypothetical protein